MKLILKKAYVNILFSNVRNLKE